MKKYDVIVIGGGPGGCATATYLARAGVSVAVFERETFPRFHIGESLLPATMPRFKELGFYDKLNSGKYIQKYGARFVDHKSNDEIYFGFEDGFNPEIPMAFEVLRSEFDTDFLNHARESGVSVYQPVRVKDLVFDDKGVVATTTEGEFSAKYLVDASGRDAVIGKRMKMRQPNKGLNNVAVFAHYTGIKRHPGKDEGDIIVGLLPERAWTWVIPFKGEHTSVGVVCSSSVFTGAADLHDYVERSLNASPRMREYMASAERASEFTVISGYSHTSETLVGDRWVLAGDAAAFLDPIFSSGVHMAVSSGKLASEALIEALHANSHLTAQGINTRYQDRFMLGAKRFRNLIGMFYEGDFVQQMKKTLTLKNARQGFTSAVAGDVWNDDNFLFSKGVL